MRAAGNLKEMSRVRKDPIKELSRRLKTPRQVQNFLRRMPYNREHKGETLRSAQAALKAGTAHCFEAAFLAAAILEHHGFAPTVLSFESQDGLDHVLFVYQQGGKWGAIGRSRDEGLHGRSPVFRSLRDLAWSYYDPYVDGSGKITAYQMAHLDDMKTDWRASTKNVWKAERYLIDLKHKPLRSSVRRYRQLLKNFQLHGPLLKGPFWW